MSDRWTGLFLSLGAGFCLAGERGLHDFLRLANDTGTRANFYIGTRGLFGVVGLSAGDAQNEEKTQRSGYGWVLAQWPGTGCLISCLPADRCFYQYPDPDRHDRIVRGLIAFSLS